MVTPDAGIEPPILPESAAFKASVGVTEAVDQAVA